MAIKWAVANGNWTAGATWNDGSIPASGDYVYLNGYTITYETLSFDGTISNEANDDYSVVAGGFLNSTSRSVSATINVTTIIAVVRIINYNHSIAGVGDYLTCANFYVKNGTTAITCQINSNYLTGNFHLLVSGAELIQAKNTNIRNITINGNVYGVEGTSLCGSLQSTHTINGVIQVTAAATTTSINGVVDMALNNSINASTLNINGYIRYRNNRGGCGIQYTVMNIANPDTFTWKDITEPRTNPFVILTNYDLNNHQQYPAESDVKKDVPYAYGQKVGTYTPDFPQEANVMQGVTYDNGNKTGTLAPVVLGDYPDVDKVLVGTIFDYGNKVGTLEPTADYPAEADVKEGVIYDYGQKEGTLSVSTDYPQEANVLQGVEYAYGSMVGTLEVVQMQADYPSEDDVRFDVVFDFGNKQGKCHVPIPEDVRDGVPVDVNEVGTLIPSSGGDRLRIADFGYYTNAQSDTYIVDITEADKPKFASAEERILIEMFPTLDLDNIPEMYFDDLFVKYLKYRLIVEYYRTAGVNSTFTPSEPTTEIVNYRNVTCEVWLNSANTYLNAWNKKFGLNKPPQKIRL